MDGRVRIALGGAAGRMGRSVEAAIAARADVELTAVFGRAGAEGRVMGGRTLVGMARALEAADVVIDFSSAEGGAALAEAAAARGGPALVLGATGYSPKDEARIDAAAGRVAIVRSGNFSIGVALLRGLVEAAARRLEARDWDIEIVEAHHRAKHDAPSGTALMLGAAAARGRGAPLSDLAALPREGADGPRREGEIGFAVVRAGGLVGEHSVLFAAEDEIVTFSHSARDRRVFATGAIEAALWATGRAPGLYGMSDVLDFWA